MAILLIGPIPWRGVANGIKAGRHGEIRWHELRHTWAGWPAQKGVPLTDIQEMGVWETVAMVKRYAHWLAAHLAHRARVIDELIITDWAPSPNRESVSH